MTVLDRIAIILAERPYPIRIEGHTDTRPIKTSQFPSNWELSAARAARIVRLFEAHGIGPGRMVVAGLGENRPLADNTTEEGRNRNRRVTIVILGKPPADRRPDAGGIAEAARRSRCRRSCDMSPVDRIGPGLPTRRIERIADKRRKPEPDKRQRRDKKKSPEKRSDGRDHIIDELA